MQTNSKQVERMLERSMARASRRERKRNVKRNIKLLNSKAMSERWTVAEGKVAA